MRADLWMERRTRRSDDWTLTDTDELPVFPALQDTWSDANRAMSPPVPAPQVTPNPFAVSPETRVEIAERGEYNDAYFNGGGSFAPPAVFDSSLDPKCLTPDGEREELERRFGRPVTDEEVRQHREAVGMAGSRDAFDHDRKEATRIYRDGSQQTPEEHEREVNARTFANMTSGPFAAMAYSAAGVFTPNAETKMWASGAMAALEQAGGAVVVDQERPGALGEIHVGHANPARTREPASRPGRYVPMNQNTGEGLPLPRDRHGRNLPSSDAPHTQIGWRKGRSEDYRQTREFDGQGNEVKTTDWTTHGRPSEHTSPHDHFPVPNPTGGSPRRGRGEKPKVGS